MTLLFLNLGGGEVFVILVVVLLLFGSKKIPELARGLGQGIREFKDATNGVQRELERSIHQPPTAPPRPQQEERIEPKPREEAP
jgi:TatA/E family protein of Tat protein translocase